MTRFRYKSSIEVPMEIELNLKSRINYILYWIDGLSDRPAVSTCLLKREFEFLKPESGPDTQTSQIIPSKAFSGNYIQGP